MPRKNNIPEREAVICGRVREIRAGFKLSRVAFATYLRVDSSTLANIEHLRVPLRYEIGRRLCGEFSISQRWLATGRKPKAWFVPVAAAIEKTIPWGALFSRAFDEVLSGPIEEYIEMVQSHVTFPIESLGEGNEWHGFAPPAGTGLQEGLDFYLTKIVRFNLYWLPAELKGSFFDAVSGAVTGFMASHKRRIDQLRGEASTQPAAASLANEKESEEKGLTDTYGARKQVDMKSELPGLLKRVALLTKPKGMKTELAKTLGVPQSRISEWLKDRGSPTADVALKLLRWVEQREAK
jgi:DNA-binding transcriptional regulator YiaG